LSDYAKPLPADDPANRPFWEGARRGVVMLQRCLECGRHRFPGARYCAQCRGAGSAWVETSGAGVIESFCTFHKAYWPGFASDVPYEVVQVLLDEGVRLFSNLVGVPRERIRLGMRVRARFEAVTPEVTLVKFSEAE
jgi:uncharacterized OB-fold protein